MNCVETLKVAANGAEEMFPAFYLGFQPVAEKKVQCAFF
jgi:hypothetical protein